MNDVKRMTLRLPLDTWHRLRDEAHDNHTSINLVILEQIDAAKIDWRDHEAIKTGARCATAQAAHATADYLYRIAERIEQAEL